MRSRGNHQFVSTSLAVLGLLLLGSTIACSGSTVHAEKAPAESGDEVLAKVGDLEVTQAEVEVLVATDLRQLAQQRYDILERGLEAIITEKMVQLEAESQGLTVEEYLKQNITDKVADPSEAEIDQFYEARKGQIRQTREEVGERITTFLRQQREQEVMAGVMADLKAKYAVKSFLEPIRLEVAADGFPAVGPADAPVTIVEFSDFECPYCSRVLPALRQVKEQYGDQVRLVFRQFPLRNLHPNAQKAAEAALCANEQGKFWEMHDLMFEEQRELAVEQLKSKAARLGLDTGSFDECLDSARFAAAVAADFQAGTEAGVSGTPAMFVNGRFLNGAKPFEEIAKVIDQELERVQ